VNDEFDRVETHDYASPLSDGLSFETHDYASPLSDGLSFETQNHASPLSDGLSFETQNHASPLPDGLSFETQNFRLYRNSFNLNVFFTLTPFSVCCSVQHSFTGSCSRNNIYSLSTASFKIIFFSLSVLRGNIS